MNNHVNIPVNLGWVIKAYLSDNSVKFYGAIVLCCICLLGAVALGYSPLNLTLPKGSPWGNVFLIFLLGWLIYLAEEYFTHVFIFHMRAPKNHFLYRLLYRLHMGHHDMPKRLDILITPMWFTFPMLMLNVAAFYWLASGVIYAVALTLGLILGYLIFEWFHLLVHTPYPVKNAWLRFIKKRHLAHHYTTEKRWFTVSPLGSLLDDIFLTGGDIIKATPSRNPQNGDLLPEDPRVLAARSYYENSSRGNIHDSSA